METKDKLVGQLVFNVCRLLNDTDTHTEENKHQTSERKILTFKMLRYHSIGIAWLLILFHGCESNGGMRFGTFKRGSSRVKEGDIRLAGSQRPSEGRVEIYHDGQWGTVCDDGWDMAEAQVVCRQLNFPAAKQVLPSAETAYGPIWMDDMDCKGTEKYLHTCKFKGWGQTDCTHKEDVWVVCDTGANTTFSSSYPLDHSIVLSDELGELFDSGMACDFSITAQSSSTDEQEAGRLQTTGETICAHKMILSHVSAFNITDNMTNLTVEVVHTCLPHFSAFIRYIYTRKIDVTFSSVQCLHWLASTFGVDQLIWDTGVLFNQILPDDASFETQVSIHEYAVETSDLVLQENCARYLAWNFQNFTSAPLWSQVSVDLLNALLARSDLVVPDEWFVFRAVENWILNNVNTSLDVQVELLSLVRFPMIPAEKLMTANMHINSSLYSTHKSVFNDNMLKALQFHFQLLTHIKFKTKMSIDNTIYQPRIYTSALWSISVDSLKQSHSYNPHQYYDTTRVNLNVPYHSSLIFHDSKITWEVNIFKHQHECSNRGMRCPSLPMLKQSSHDAFRQPGIVFQNRVLLMCQGRYVCQIQDFKSDMAYISKNASQTFPYPCPDDQYKYIFVVRPEYI